MDVYEATTVVFARLHVLDPENASKIMGMLLIQDDGERDLIRLALGPDHLLPAYAARARAYLDAKPSSPPFAGDQDGGEAEKYDCWSPASFSLSYAAEPRPCLYYARGLCKNGSSCRFLHEDDAEREMAVMRATAARPQQLMASTFPFSPSPTKGGLNLQRAAFQGGEDMPMRSPRMDSIPAARQIYLTFLADSTFTEEDVSNYFSIYGPLQGVRIPYQQKRMFGFVTFVYADTVKLILAKGNPHFICQARVLVKTYKEKGNHFSFDRRKPQQHPHHGDTLLLDSRDPFDLHQPQIGPRMMYGRIANHEAFLPRKLEEQQQAAIELQGRRFMELQLLELKSRLGSPVGSSMSLGQTDNGNGNAVHLEDVTIQDNKLNSVAMSAPAPAAEGKHEEQIEEDGDGTPKQAVNPGEEHKRESGPRAPPSNVACGFQESGVDHNLPESPLASPTKASIDTAAIAQNGNINNSSPHHVASSLFPPTPPPLSCPPTIPASFKCPGPPLGMKSLGCEYRAQRGLLSSKLGGL